MTTLKQPAAEAPVRALLGTKLGMTQIWDEDGRLRPVTVVRVDTNVVTQIRTLENDGYEAVQLAFGEIPERKVTKPLKGHFERAGVAPRRHIAEVRTALTGEYSLGQELGADVFEAGQLVDVTGTSKGKGFQGTIKRWNFSRGPMTHGSRNQRKPGYIGQCAYPARVRKGLHMAGHMGDERVTVKNLKLVRVDVEQNLMLVKGAVPGGKNALVSIRMA